jgi:hypothetical protein
MHELASLEYLYEMHNEIIIQFISRDLSPNHSCETNFILISFTNQAITLFFPNAVGSIFSNSEEKQVPHLAIFRDFPLN